MVDSITSGQDATNNEMPVGQPRRNDKGWKPSQMPS
jgi:hypothetical protein